jgi:hypothetical protein
VWSLSGQFSYWRRHCIYCCECMCGKCRVHRARWWELHGMLGSHLQGCHRSCNVWSLSGQFSYWRRHCLYCCECMCGKCRLHRARWWELCSVSCWRIQSFHRRCSV